MYYRRSMDDDRAEVVRVMSDDESLDQRDRESRLSLVYDMLPPIYHSTRRYHHCSRRSNIVKSTHLEHRRHSAADRIASPMMGEQHNQSSLWRTLAAESGQPPYDR